jgi:creatinine amidohydrolase/Fe(II)-dependent formamide hydrolase-like protein
LAVGVAGDPQPATAALGQIGVDLVVAQSVAAIRAALAEHR